MRVPEEASARLRIVLDGQTYDPYGPGTAWADLPADEREEAIRSGSFITPGGEPMPERTANRVRHRLRGTYAHLPLPGDNADVGEVSYLVDGIWPRGTIPLLGGNQKAGKSTLGADLTASLLTPGRLFLGRFETRLTEEERERGVWVVNAENPPDLFEEEVWGQWEEGTGNAITLDHLDHLGGPQAFDLTDSNIYELWLNRFVECRECQGDDDTTPAVVIVDGLTAILGGDTSRYAAWYVKFKQLMRELDVPSALAVGHNTQAGGHLMGGIEALGAPDGLWSYWSADPDNANSARYFKTVPRLGAPAVDQTRVLKVEGRLLLDDTERKDEARAHPTEVHPYEDEVRARLDAAGSEGLRKTEVTGSGGFGTLRRKALNSLIEAGEVVTRPEAAGRNPAERCWLASHLPG